MNKWLELLVLLVLIFYVVINEGERVSNGISTKEATKQIEALTMRQIILVGKIMNNRQHSAFHKHNYDTGEPFEWEYGEYKVMGSYSNPTTSPYYSKTNF